MLSGLSSSNFSADYWSLGVIMYEMLTGVPPFNDVTVDKIFENILNQRMEWPDIGIKFCNLNKVLVMTA